MNYFSAADWTVIALYLIGIILLGIWFGKDQKNTRDYFLGSKNIPWWGIGLSIVAAETSALTIIGVPGSAYGSDLAFIQMIVGYVIARIVLAAVMVPHYLRGEIYSPYELLAHKFGASARRTAGGLFLLMETLAAGVRVYVVSIPIQLMLGVDVFTAVMLFVVLSLIYTYIGGVKAVIWTDAVQFGFFLAGGVFTLFYVPSVLEGGWGKFWEQASASGKLHWFNPQFSLSQPINIWMGVIGGTVQVMSSHGAEQLIVQRVLACRTIRDGRRALVLSAALVFPLFLVFLLVGAMLWVFYQNNPMAIDIPTNSQGMKANDYVYPIFMLTEVPHVLKGFLIVAILSAAMSSISSALTSLASVSTMDFVKQWIGNKNEMFYLKFSKYSTISWALALIAVGYLSRHVSFVLDAAFALRGLTSGALLGGLLMAVFWRKTSPVPVVAGMLAALTVMTCIEVMPKWQVTQSFWVRWINKQPIHWPWYTLIGTVTCLSVAAITGHFLNRKQPDEAR